MRTLTVHCTSAFVVQVVAEDFLSLHELKVSRKPVRPTAHSTEQSAYTQSLFVCAVHVVWVCVLQVVADDPLSLHELKVSSKTGAQRQRQLKQQEKAARGAGRGAHLGPGVEEVEVDESQLQGVPVLWVQVGRGVGVHVRQEVKLPLRWVGCPPGCVGAGGPCPRRGVRGPSGFVWGRGVRQGGWHLKQQENAAQGAGCGACLCPGVEEVEVDESQLQGVPVLWVQVGGMGT